ncbi:MAG: hypothetical protein ACNS62_07890 [Candidatus Cyclobacteriaceae bacterium M3_2C_046]
MIHKLADQEEEDYTNTLNMSHDNSEFHHKLLKTGIWVYFLLLIFEGALRKWVLPSLATPLLVIRDPVAIGLIFLAWKNNLFPHSKYLILTVVVVTFSSITTMLLGHQNLPVMIFGARIFLIHFPLIFIIGSVFERKDVIQMGKVLLWISIPMAVLIALQFYSPQSSLVNRGIGGDMGGAGFSGAMGFFRPPGTFAFTNGTTLFYSMVACYILYFWFNAKEINKIILMGATAALLIAIPLSISRGLVFQVAVSVLFAALVLFRKPKYAGRMIIAFLGILILLVIFNNAVFFQTAIEVFEARFDNASQSEGGLEGTLIDRFLGGLLSALTESVDQPIFGYGIGMGTNVGSMMLTGGVTYLISEGEWGRLVGEMGPILGLAIIFIRIGLSFKIGIASYKWLALGDTLPWLLLSFGLLQLVQGQWAQATALGFAIMIGGLLIAVLMDNREKQLK